MQWRVLPLLKSAEGCCIIWVGCYHPCAFATTRMRQHAMKAVYGPLSNFLVRLQRIPKRCSRLQNGSVFDISLQHAVCAYTHKVQHASDRICSRMLVCLSGQRCKPVCWLLWECRVCFGRSECEGIHALELGGASTSTSALRTDGLAWLEARCSICSM